ncbi:MAG TPA: nitrate reductase molybdenum cofactor assembly chaperone [Dermatophilaceae bacterium]|nr:nitrate reductase molybdenum cofactor assembly chaperone [Dermatophilaceae bacterium]
MSRVMLRTRRGEAVSEPQRLAVWQLVSLLLDYPSAALYERVPAIRSLGGLPATAGASITAFVAALEDLGLGAAQRRYVETFDHARRCCPYLTYFFYGDTRRRGMALLRLKQAYRQAGLELGPQELPDHLCVVLEFGATADAAAAARILADYRASVEVLRIALEERGSPWAHLLVALCSTLPELDGDDVLRVQRLVAHGPPVEEVGLDGYAADPRMSDRRVSLGDRIPVGAPR